MPTVKIKPFTPAGTETPVNTTTAGLQYHASIAALADGGYVVVWTDSDSNVGDIFAQRYDAAGDPVGTETRINGTTSLAQDYPVVTAIPGGGYAVAWHGNGGSDSDGIFFRAFDAAGDPIFGETRANGTTANIQDFAAITVMSDGSFVVAWESNLQDGGGLGIYVRRFDAAGTSLGNAALVNETTTDDQRFPSVTALAGGEFVVTWQSFDINNWNL
jgi:hypothetical protein